MDLNNASEEGQESVCPVEDSGSGGAQSADRESAGEGHEGGRQEKDSWYSVTSHEYICFELFDFLANKISQLRYVIKIYCI